MSVFLIPVGFISTLSSRIQLKSLRLKDQESIMQLIAYLKEEPRTFQINYQLS